MKQTLAKEEKEVVLSELGGGTLQLWRVNEWIYDDSAELLNKIGELIEKNTMKKK